MPASLLMFAVDHAPMLLGAVAMCVVALASVRRARIENEGRTRRLESALIDSKPEDRPDIIIACSKLEKRTRDSKSLRPPVSRRYTKD